MADYAEPLKRAWKAMVCPSVIIGTTGETIFCKAYDSKYEYCKGHAALLEMVHAYVMAQTPYTFDAARIERRLRAAVGVKNGKK